jgi:signal transduction histidine kinase
MSAFPEGSGGRDDLDEAIHYPDHLQLIGRSFFVYTRVRTLVVLTLVAATLFARYVLRLEDLDVRSLALLAGCMAVYNVGAWAFFRRYRVAEGPVFTYPVLLGVTYGAVILDLLAVTAAVWLVGGARSPFSAFYVPLIMISCILLSSRVAMALSALAYTLLVALIMIEWSGAATPHLPVGAVESTGPLTPTYVLTLLVVYGMLFGLCMFLLLTVTRSLRRIERRMQLANAELTRLSQQRRDFLNIAAHNLRAPVGAVSMLLENMRSGVAGCITDKQRDWLDRCLRRLGRLTDFMSEIQTLSSLETDIIKNAFGPVDVADLARRLVSDHVDVAEERGHSLTVEVPEAVPRVVGHEHLLREAMVNYLTNSIKYTPNGGTIVVRVLHRDPMVRIEVQDNGIGISEEDQARLFREFVRIPTRGTAVDEPAGSGLGLSIVQRIALAHGGRTGVVSAPNQGSTFYLELPALRE